MLSDKADATRIWAEVDLEAVRHNVRVLRGTLKHGAALMAVVKSGAYGHGGAQVARAALSAGAARLGVNEVSEGVELRDAGIRETSVQLLAPCLPEELSAGIEYDLSFAVSSLDELRAVADRSRALNQGLRRGKRAKVHLMVDTGMGRAGFWPDEVWPATAHLLAEKTLELGGIFTHFSSAEETDPKPTQQQVKLFRDLMRYCQEQGVRFPVRHAANSAATVFHPDAQLDMVRCGVLLHGMRAWPPSRDNLELLPTLALYTRIVHVGRRPAGSTVGYNRQFVCQRDSILATLPIGYADGYRRALTGRSNVILRGMLMPVVGTISMNQIVIDVTPMQNSAVGLPEIGETAILIGGSPENRISVEEIAEKSGTIPYVVTTQLGQNVQRRYIGVDTPVLVEELKAELRAVEPPVLINMPARSDATQVEQRVASA